jgi:hypothetical protein
MITLTQLIDLLTLLPRELRVVVRGYEASADDITRRGAPAVLPRRRPSR